MHCTEKIVSAYWHAGSVSAEMVGWEGHPKGAMHMAAARLGCIRTMVGIEWANSCPGCMSRLRKYYSYYLGGSFLVGKASWTLSRCLPTKTIACSLMSGHG